MRNLARTQGAPTHEPLNGCRHVELARQSHTVCARFSSFKFLVKKISDKFTLPIEFDSFHRFHRPTLMW